MGSSIDNASLGDGDGLNEVLGELVDVEVENLTTSLTDQTRSLAVGTGEANCSSSSPSVCTPPSHTRLPSRGKNGGTPRGPLTIPTPLTSLLIVGTSELGLLLSIEVSAESALLVLVVLAHLDLGGVSVEVDSDVIEFDNNHLVLLVDTGLLESLDSLDLLSINGDTHLLSLLVHLEFDDRLGRDDLHLLLLSVRRDLLEKDGERRLLGRAVLSEDRVASGQGSAVDDVIERVDLAGLNGALGLGLLKKGRSELGDGTDGSHGLATDVHDTKGIGETEITEDDLLGGSLDGKVGILASLGLESQLGAHDSLLVVTEFDRTSHGALDVVLGDNLVLVEHGSFDETRVLLDGAHLVLLALDLHLENVLLVGSPTGVDRDGELTVLLGEEFLEGRGHLGVEHLDGRLDSPVTGLLLEEGSNESLHLQLAVSHLVVADGVQFDLGLAFLAGSDRLDLSHHTVGVSLVALVGLDVLVEGSTTLFLILDVLLVILSLEVLLVVLLVESVHLGFLHSRVLVEDGLLLGLDVGASLLGPDTNEGDGAGLELDETAGFLGEGEGGLDLELLVPVHLSGHLEGHVDIDRVEELDSEVENGELHLDLGDVSGSESGAGLKTETESIDGLAVLGLELNLDETVDLEDGGHLAGVDKRRSHRVDDGTSALVDEGREDSVEAESLGEDGLDLAELNSSIADDGLDDLGNDFLVDGEKGVVHVTESDVDQSVGVLLLLLARDDGELGEESTEDLGGLEGGGSLSTDDHLLESLLVNLLDEVVQHLVDVVLGESDLGEVLVPLSGEGGLEGGHDLLGKHRVVGEESGPVEGETGLGLLVEESPVLVGGGDHLAGLLTDHSEGSLDGISHGLLARNLGAGKMVESLVDEGVHLGGGLVLELVGDLFDDRLLGNGLHDLVEGSDSHLGMLTS
ncbi:hypothetical protein PFISCL1PPCAC_15992, partial [Pristionchus fissidentatus]